MGAVSQKFTASLERRGTPHSGGDVRPMGYRLSFPASLSGCAAREHASVLGTITT